MAVRAGYADNWETGSSEASGNQLYFRDAILEASEASGLAGGLAKLNTGSQGSHVIANKNEVHISGTKTEIRSSVNGGNAMTNNFAQAGSMAQANENKVFITDGASVIGTVCGAQINGNHTDTNGWYAEAHDNFVEIKDSSFGPQNGSTDGIFSVYGAVMYAWRVRNAYKNEVEISNSNFTGGHQDGPNKSSVTALSIYSFSDPVEVRGNSVRISKSIIDGYNILGTNISTTDRAGVSNTTVEVSNGSNIGGYVRGDFVSARSGDVIAEGERSVSVSDSTIGGYIQGLYLSTSYGNASAQGGSVSVSHSVVGSYILGDNVAAPEGSASVFGGSVSVSSGTTVKGFISGLSVDAKKAIAEGGSVSVSETTVEGYVFGASTTVKQNSSATSRASRNTVTIENSKIGNVVYGGYAVNKSSGIAEASGNILTLKNVNVPSFIIPGFAQNDGSGKAVAEGNTVTLRGGTYSGSIFGSYAYAAGSAATAGGNIVTLQGDDMSGGGSPSFNPQNTVIWGSLALVGRQEYAPGSPNTLNFIDAKGMTAANISNFSILKYTLPNMKAQESVLTLTGGANNEKTDISNASVSIAVADVRGRNGGEFGFGGDKSPENDRIILLKNDNGLTSDGWKQEGEITAREGVSLSFDLAAGTDDTSLYLYRPETIIDPTDPDHPHPNDTVVNPQTKALAEGWLAGLTLGIQAGNVAADQGIGAMRYAAVRLDRDGWLPFGVLEGGSLKYDSGSHIDLQSLSLLAGLGRGVSTDLGLLIVGGFFEYGTGSYKTHNTFDTMPSVDGSGNAWYMGGGLLASMDFKKTGDGHFYLEGSAHTGMLHNSFDGDALRDAYGRSAEFDTDTPYYNLHAGLGYLWNIAEDHSLDIYGKYYWTRVLGTDETLNTGDPVDFDDITSSRTRLGARYAYQATEHVSTYIGAAWEHEFEGVSDSSVFGYDIDSPKIRGDSGRGEMGLRFTPTDDLPLTVDLGVQGYAGKKEGVTGSLFVQYEF